MLEWAYLPLIVTSKNPCYAQATWDWICLKKKQNKTKQKQIKTKKQNKTKTNKQTNKQKIKN